MTVQGWSGVRPGLSNPNPERSLAAVQAGGLANRETVAFRGLTWLSGQLLEEAMGLHLWLPDGSSCTGSGCREHPYA